MSSAKYTQLALSLWNQTLYALKVGQHIAVKVYEKEKMSPPSGKEIEQSFDALKHVFKSSFNMAKSKQLPNVEQLKLGGRVGLELLGFFTVGEMIGRGSLVGYKINKH